VNATASEVATVAPSVTLTVRATLSRDLRRLEAPESAVRHVSWLGETV